MELSSSSEARSVVGFGVVGGGLLAPSSFVFSK